MGIVLRARCRLVAVLPALLLLLVACGGEDDMSSELSDALEEAGFDEDDLDDAELEEAEEMLDGMDTALEIPDDFPEEIPLPDDARVVANSSGSHDDNRYIEIQFVWSGDMDEWIERYQTELPAIFDITEEGIAETEEESSYLGGGLYSDVWGEWRFTADEWESGTLRVMDAPALVESIGEAWGIGEEWGEDMEDRYERDIVEPFAGADVSVLVTLNEQSSQ